MKYKKDKYMYSETNEKYQNKSEYVPTTAYERVLNPKTEQYEYKEIIINDKLDWENTEKAILNSLLNTSEKE